MDCLSWSEQRAFTVRLNPAGRGMAQHSLFLLWALALGLLTDPASQAAGPAGTWLCESKGKQVPVVLFKRARLLMSI